ncbi:sensor histidine kinase [Subtercola boreus]|uniref:sensor histidine kinase n=1 Tax=Subtercola boreus TaxID=120213 RepID=UPI0011515AB5|nr:HAMP domain-containing sensor histidine kinase [Subtercola boreus]TQL55915.1 HAMP domain-containing protein [Subtercola boreus]
MRLARRLSIRVRLTVGTLVIAGVFFAGTAVVVHRQVDSILRSSSVMLLEGDLAQYQQEIADGRSSNLDTPAQGQLVAVIDPVGRVMQSSLPAELEPQLSALAAAGTAVQDVRTPAARYLVLARQVSSSDGVWSVVTARNEAASSLSLDNLTRALAWGLVILTLLFGVGSWLLASAALRPVSAMRRTAERLTGSASVELLPVGPAHDELFYLASTLNDLITQLRASADREKQLVSDASHELRTPLAILQTQLELAHLSTGDADALLGEIESAERTVQRLSALAASLLELTRIEGMTAQETTTFDDLAEELADAIDRARLISIGSEIVVDYEVLPDGTDGGGERESAAETVTGPSPSASPWPPPSLSPPTVPPATSTPPATPMPPAGRSRNEVFDLSGRSFGRVADNLLGNAIVAVNEAAGPGTGSVRATLARTADGIRLEISDTGPGMSPDFIPLAFDRFAREDESRGGTRPGSRGAGLGLSIVLALVASAGGTVTMTNRRPRGLSAVVTLPASRDPAHPPAPAAAPSPPPPPPSQDQNA